MNLNEYQALCSQTWTDTQDPGLDLLHAALGICGEAGEIAELFKKGIRGDNGGDIDHDKLTKELGDVLYYVVTVARLAGISAAEVAQANINKIMDRKARGVIKGSGDNR